MGGEPRLVLARRAVPPRASGCPARQPRRPRRADRRQQGLAAAPGLRGARRRRPLPTRERVAARHRDDERFAPSPIGASASRSPRMMPRRAARQVGGGCSPHSASASCSAGTEPGVRASRPARAAPGDPRGGAPRRPLVAHRERAQQVDPHESESSSGVTHPLQEPPSLAERRPTMGGSGVSIPEFTSTRHCARRVLPPPPRSLAGCGGSSKASTSSAAQPAGGSSTQVRDEGGLRRFRREG